MSDTDKDEIERMYRDARALYAKAARDQEHYAQLVKEFEKKFKDQFRQTT